MYRCAQCGKPLRNDTNGQAQCDNDKCGSWIFVKERPNTKKTLKSD